MKIVFKKSISVHKENATLTKIEKMRIQNLRSIMMFRKFLHINVPQKLNQNLQCYEKKSPTVSFTKH